MKYYVTVCAWCGKEISRKPHHENVVSHGMCKECVEKVLRERQTRERDATSSDRR